MRLIDIVKRDLVIIGILLALLLIFVSLKLSFGAQIVCIDTGTLRSGICELNDIVAIQDDNVELTGAGYNNFKIIQVRGLDKNAAWMVLDGSRVNTYADANTIEYWNDPNTGNWYRIINKPKYIFTTRNLTIEDINNLSGGVLSPAEILNTMGKIEDKIPLDPNNSLIIRARLRRFIIFNILNAEETNAL